MPTPVIETSGLRKEYAGRRGRSSVAVDGLDLVVEQGGVHGFLGPNGSGKTTTIRMLLGLASPSAGEMRLFGEPVPRRLPHVLRRVGALVEQPKFLPSFSGRRNLSLLATAGGVPASAVGEAVERVGLAGRDGDPVRAYSLGMRQRLAVAATLLKAPELLILDEPSNGLDPAGIRDMRDMIRQLADSGVTVLLSSHLLAEVQQSCDAVSIISAGRLLASGRVDQLVGKEHDLRLRVVVRREERERAAQILREGLAGGDVPRASDGEVTVDPQASQLLVTGVDEPSVVTELLARQGIFLRELVVERPDLEQVFLELTRGETTP